MFEAHQAGATGNHRLRAVPWWPCDTLLLQFQLMFIALLWLIELLDRTFDLQLYRFGVLPHAPEGLGGILLAPLIHGSWGHLLSNSFALLILLTALLYGYPRSAKPALDVGAGMDFATPAGHPGGARAIPAGTGHLL